MITAHAPAGYIGAQLLYRLKLATVSARAWSFLLELALWAWAAALFLRQRRQAHAR